MQCHIMRYLIRVCTVCLKATLNFRERSAKCLGIITYDPSIYANDHPNLTVSNFMDTFIGLKNVKLSRTFLKIACVGLFRNERTTYNAFTISSCHAGKGVGCEVLLLYELTWM